MANNIELCAWRIGRDIVDANFKSCRVCKGTRDYAIAEKCPTCLFQNADESYTSSYLNLIKEREAELAEAGTR